MTGMTLNIIVGIVGIILLLVINGSQENKAESHARV